MSNTCHLDTHIIISSPFTQIMWILYYLSVSITPLENIQIQNNDTIQTIYTFCNSQLTLVFIPDEGTYDENTNGYDILIKFWILFLIL